MKITTRPEHASMLATDDWLAELHDTESAEPADPGNVQPSNPGNARPTGPDPSGPGYAVPTSYAVPASSPDHAVHASYVRAVPAGPRYTRTTLPAALPPPAPAGPAGAPARAVIGDQLRIPIMWCEMGSCVSWRDDPAALGEADARARAIGAGWRIDAFGRLACPRCQQTHPGYRTACQAVPWDRSTAMDTTAPMPVIPRDGAAGRTALRTGRDPGRAARGYPPPTRAHLEWHHDSPADQAMPADTSRSRGLVFSMVRAWRARGGRQAAPGRATEHGEDLMTAEYAHAGPAGATT